MIGKNNQIHLNISKFAEPIGSGSCWAGGPLPVHFLPRDALLSAVYAVVVCLCVCVCVCLSHSGIVSKRLNIGSRKQRRMIAPWL